MHSLRRMAEEMAALKRSVTPTLKTSSRGEKANGSTKRESKSGILQNVLGR